MASITNFMKSGNFPVRYNSFWNILRLVVSATIDSSCLILIECYHGNTNSRYSSDFPALSDGFVVPIRRKKCSEENKNWGADKYIEILNRPLLDKISLPLLP